MAARLFQRYDTRSAGAFEVLVIFSMQTIEGDIQAYFGLLEIMLCIVEAARCRDAASCSSSSKRCKSTGSSADSMNAFRNPVERVEASSSMAKDSVTRVIASEEG